VVNLSKRMKFSLGRLLTRTWGMAAKFQERNDWMRKLPASVVNP
jgi:hypothetical protein